MITTIYLIRHSIPFKEHRGIENVKSESILFSNIKTPLSIEGEKYAEKISNNEEFNNLDCVWSSNYVRAMSTAKYFAYNNNLKVNVDERFGERIHGVINSWNELPENFGINQFFDSELKLPAGESQKEVRDRMYEGLIDVLNHYKGKKVAIITHSTAMCFLLLKWCKLENNEKLTLLFNDKEIYNKGSLSFCETFKLQFKDNELISIENINL